MKKFVFTMQKMRDYKKQILEAEKNRLLGLQKEKLSYFEKINKIDDIISGLNIKAVRDMKTGTTSTKLILYNMQKEGSKREKNQLTYELKMLEITIEKQRRNVVKLSQEISGLDKLEEEQKAEYNRLAAKESENIIEEFISFKLSEEKNLQNKSL